ncbi:DUF6266 family protein [Odoribacter lunatus]|uniref:DUF6266 family protein n=1 Tax=Odoribacter lunatus TaxID=2941335 RepID=UPI00203BE239|nr:DUF6266 family protein [Odoribacter lunatus]
MIEMKNTSVFGNFTGVIDDVIVYVYRNRRCIRRKPGKVKPPSAPGQVAQQERMASIAIFYQALKEVGIYPYWQKAAEGRVANGYNLLVQQNLPAFNSNGMICDFSKIRLTDGSLALPDELRLREAEEADGWVLAWTNTPYQVNAWADDRLKLFVMKEDGGTFDVEPLEAVEGVRQDGQVMFRLPEYLQGYPHLYVLFCSHTTGACSKSKYFNLLLKRR